MEISRMIYYLRNLNNRNIFYLKQKRKLHIMTVLELYELKKELQLIRFVRKNGKIVGIKRRKDFVKKEREKNPILKTKLNSILKEISNQEHTISSLSKILNMKRSTLIYYLNFLEKDRKILRKRVEKGKTGRPSFIEIDPISSK